MNKQESLDRVCKERGLPPLKVGMQCKVDHKEGIIIVGGNCSQNIDVLFDDWESASDCHPYWRFSAYDNDGKAIYQSRS